MWYCTWEGTRGHYLTSPTAAFSGEEQEENSFPWVCVGSVTDSKTPGKRCFVGSLAGVPSCLLIYIPTGCVTRTQHTLYVTETVCIVGVVVKCNKHGTGSFLLVIIASRVEFRNAVKWLPVILACDPLLKWSNALQVCCVDMRCSTKECCYLRLVNAWGYLEASRGESIPRKKRKVRKKIFFLWNGIFFSSLCFESSCDPLHCKKNVLAENYHYLFR